MNENQSQETHWRKFDPRFTDTETQLVDCKYCSGVPTKIDPENCQKIDGKYPACDECKSADEQYNKFFKGK